MFTPDLHTDLNWLSRISGSLEGYKRQSGSAVAVCRCPICGDSKKHKSKARFYFYKTRGKTLNVDCKNCGYSRSFFNFMREAFESSFDEYKMEQVKAQISYRDYSKKADVEVAKTPTPTNPVTPTDVSDMVCVTELPLTHPARQYLQSRAMSDVEMGRLFYTDHFKALASKISPTPLSSSFPDEPRIVIPFYSETGSLEMVQGRALGDSNLRYITIKAAPDIDKVFGKNEIDPTKTVYVCEGPLDSLFVDNCLASCDSALTRIEADVYIWDNEPRNPNIHAIMRDAILAGHKLVIWPISPDHKLDINDMIKGGLSRQDIMTIIRENTFSGNAAMYHFTKWRRT